MPYDLSIEIKEPIILDAAKIAKQTEYYFNYLLNLSPYMPLTITFSEHNHYDKRFSPLQVIDHKITPSFTYEIYELEEGLDVSYKHWGDDWQVFSDYPYYFDVSPMKPRIDGFQNVKAMPLLIAVTEAFDWPYISVFESVLRGIETDFNTDRFLVSHLLTLRNPKPQPYSIDAVIELNKRLHAF